MAGIYWHPVCLSTQHDDSYFFLTKSRSRPHRPPAGRPGRSQRYKHPVPGGEAILAKLKERGVPVAVTALADSFHLKSQNHREALRKTLHDLAAAGQLIVNRQDEACLLEKLDAVSGVVSAHRDGYGFLIADDGSPDVYLPQSEMRQLLNGDRAAVRIAGDGTATRRSGTVIEILQRGRTTIVGRYQRQRGVGYVVEYGRSPHNFVVQDGHRGEAQDGQLVKAEIIVYPADNHEAQAKVLRLLGNPEDDPGVATDAAIEMFNLPHQWSATIRRAAADWGSEVRPEDRRHREDLRELPLVTIDGADARDFDDAVFAEPIGEGWRLVVAIADVSHYVRPGDEIDQEAERRATSIYFPDRVLPMLPEALSNGLCSLNPRVDRLSMVCDMRISARGEVSRSRFYRAVMRSAARLTYDDVQAARDGDLAVRSRLGGLWPRIADLYGVHQVLAAARARRGALDLDLPEVKIELGGDGRIEKISLRDRNDAHRLIEECMISANVEAGRFPGRREMSGLYRVHAGPDPEKFEDLRLMLQALGCKVTAQAAIRTRDLNRLLHDLAGRPDYPMLATAVLRTMSQAVYQPKNIGHFGLALPVYTHFTSPIRRYPDLLVHRGIGHILDGRKPGAFGYDHGALEVLGKSCSERERRADEAARHVEARYKCAFARERIGEVMHGVITGVTHFGIFVMLRDLNVDGLVHVSALRNDYYHLRDGGLRLVGERSGRSFGLGDQLEVRIDRVNVDEAKIDLSLAGEDMPIRSSRGSGRGRPRRR